MKVSIAPNTTVEPCHHMKSAVSKYAQGTLSGPLKIYTALHVKHCSQCSLALAEMRKGNKSDGGNSPPRA